ncbi:MAG: thrombospondin type 3 repeat-containing protein [Gammaproteobacteria bacterium]
MKNLCFSGFAWTVMLLCVAVAQGQSLELVSDERLRLDADMFSSWFLDAQATIVPDADSDSDGVADAVDNCIFDANPAQVDADGDGFGNRCDIDFNQDGWPGVIDLGVMRSRFFSDDPVVDVNADGVVNVQDLALFRSLYFQPPGPSGLVSDCD